MQNGGEASPSIILADLALLVKMLITLGPHDIFCSNFVYLCILTLPPATGMQNSDEASPSIILAGRALFVKMLIPLEPRSAFGSNFIYLCNIVHPLICKTATRLHRASFWPVKLF